ncbi:MAG: DUF2007 domain-containing protein [Crocinitomicaceae bacterium]|nr:DUF2007 domain-containing protein [Crocinitomicaceae bacterium]
MELITLKTFDSAIDAHILKARIEADGIPCYIFDENIVTLDPLLNFAVGGIKLKVDERDIEQSKEILVAINKMPYHDSQEKDVCCPNCDSTNLINDFKSMKGIKGFLSAVVSFLLMVFPIYYSSVFKCRDCDTEFRPK